ncbi:MAG: phosphoribosylglycinamide formyltransferase [Enterobacteriaceae bacterium]
MSQARARLLVMASGSGSNFQVLQTACQNGQIAATLVQLICDQPQATVLQRAAQAGIPSQVISPKAFDSRAEHDRALLAFLQQVQPDLIVLAGYMRLLAPQVVEPFYGRMINIHPSLLPEFSGLQAMERAWQAQVPESGITVHFVDSGLDSGPVIAQRRVACASQPDFATFRTVMQQQEHQLLPAVVQDLLCQRVRLQDRQVVHTQSISSCR